MVHVVNARPLAGASVEAGPGGPIADVFQAIQSSARRYCIGAAGGVRRKRGQHMQHHTLTGIIIKIFLCDCCAIWQCCLSHSHKKQIRAQIRVKERGCFEKRRVFKVKKSIQKAVLPHN